MPRFVISARGEAREQYIVDAESEDLARTMFLQGNLPQPTITEVHDSELVSIDEIPMPRGYEKVEPLS